MHYDITPCAKPRMTRGDKFRKRPATQRYWDFKRECLLKKVKLYEEMRVIFFMPMPKSWSKKKKAQMVHMPHKQKPDLDNLLKGLMDILPEDSHLYNVHAEKYWSDTGGIGINQLSKIMEE